jgi:hypothetical protein
MNFLREEEEKKEGKDRAAYDRVVHFSFFNSIDFPDRRPGDNPEGAGHQDPFSQEDFYSEGMSCKS